MDIDRNKAIKLVIVIVATLAALAVMSTVVQLLQTMLPFLIVGAGIYAGYRWALNDMPAPSPDEVEEQARGLFGRFRKGKQAVETSMKVGAALNEITGDDADKPEEKEEASPVPASQAKEKPWRSQGRRKEREAADSAKAKPVQAKTADDMKSALESNPKGKIEFKDRDVVISLEDVVQPDISRLQEKEKEEPQVNDSVFEQIEERRRRLQGGG